MRILLVLSIIMVGSFAAGSVFADEFGERFYNQAPKGLGDYTAEETEIPDIAQNNSQDNLMDDIANSLADIMPASGEEDVFVETDETQSMEE